MNIPALARVYKIRSWRDIHFDYRQGELHCPMTAAIFDKVLLLLIGLFNMIFIKNAQFYVEFDPMKLPYLGSPDKKGFRSCKFMFIYKSVHTPDRDNNICFT